MDNINPILWGPSGWKFLHYITLSYPENPDENIKKTYKNFFSELYQVLPCEKCRINYEEHLKIYPLSDKVLESKENIVKWLISMHNLVNIINNKKEYSYDDFNNEYILNQNIYNDNNTNNYQYLIFLLLLLILILLYFLIKKYI